MNEQAGASDAQSAPPYSILAAGYDFVMSHVDYDLWAAYIHELIMRHHPGANTVLELGCGTGSLAIALELFGPYRYLGTDASEHMIAVARRKAMEDGAPIRFEIADFTDFRVDEPVDVILLLFDGINYLLEEDSIRDLLSCAYAAMDEDGIFIVDQSTPWNSINNEAYFDDSDHLDGFSYVRRSRYDIDTRLHQTVLEISVGENTFREEHLQRAYELDEIRALIEKAGFAIEAGYDGFSREPATSQSERVHWVLRRPTTQIVSS